MTTTFIDPATRLPPELISRIFQLDREAFTSYYKYPWTTHSNSFRHIYHDSGQTLRLGAVCRTWRSIAWGDPSLWQHVFFGLKTNNTEELRTRTILLEEWLVRAANAPLHILAVKLDGNKISEEQLTLYEHVIQHFVARAEQWRDISTFLPNPYFTRLLDAAAGRAPNLRSAEIESDYFDQESNFSFSAFEDTPSLRYLALPGKLSKTDIQIIPWHQLEYIELSCCQFQPLPQLLPLLSRAQNLRRLHCEPDFDHNQVIEEQNVILPHLQDLHVLFRDTTSHLKFMERLTAPSLQRLQIDIYVQLMRREGLFMDSQVLERFVTRSMCANSLTHLEIRGLCFETMADESNMIKFLQQVPAIETLKFQTKAIGHSMSDEIFLRMYPSIHTKNRDFLLPSLRTLVYNGCGSFSTDIVREMLEFRWRKSWNGVPFEDVIQIREFKMKTVSKADSCDYSCIEAFLEMEREGLQLDIVDLCDNPWFPLYY